MGALTTSLTMYLSALSPQALAALWGSGDGYQISATGNGYAWGQTGGVAVNSWRVTLYVSTKDDGTIDPATDAIGSSTLAKVGTIVYDNIFNVDPTADVFIQTTEHAETRSADWKDNFPFASQVKANDFAIPGSELSIVGDGNKIYHLTDCPAELPMYGAYNNAPSGSDPFIEKVIEDLNRRLGGSTGNFFPLYGKIVSAGLGQEPIEKLNNAKPVLGDKAFDLLLPTNSDCVVQWACVVEPLVERKTNAAGTFFESFVYEPGSFYYSRCIIQAPGDPYQYLLLDAYGTAQYNESSRKLYSSSETLYNASADTHHIEVMKSKTTILDLTTKSHAISSCLDSWGANGQLLAEWGRSLLANSATVCYDTHSGFNSYCGVPVAGSAGSGLTYTSTSAVKTAATYGGIAVLFNELNESDPTLPVYYYIYDERNNFAELKQGTYTPDDNGFIPSTDYGIPIADESLSNSDQPMKSTAGDTRYFYYNDYPSLAGYVVDFKETSATENLSNPSAVTTSLRT